MLWFKAFHIITMVAWFAGLFYLPRLYVYHAMSTDNISIQRFKVMEHRLYYFIATPAAILTVGLGIMLLFYFPNYASSGWMHAKLSLVILLIGFHGYCGWLLSRFKQDTNTHTSGFYRKINEIPTVLLIAIVILVVVKP